MAWVRTDNGGKRGLAGALGGLLGGARAPQPPAATGVTSLAGLEAAFGAAPFGVYVADAAGNVQWANPALAGLLGGRRERLAGMTVHELVGAASDGRPPFDAIGGGGDGGAETVLRAADG